MTGIPEFMPLKMTYFTVSVFPPFMAKETEVTRWQNLKPDAGL